MSAIRHFIEKAINHTELDEFLAKRLDRAGYCGVEATKTPLGTRIIIYAARPGVVIGRRGTSIRELTDVLEEKFKFSNPQIAVSETKVPELNPGVMASRIADALQRGIHFRRTGFWALNRIMRAGALGCEIIIKGKLRSRRHRCEKYRDGYIPRSGYPALKNTRTAIANVKLKQGILGVKVKIIPPDAIFPDKISIKPIRQLEKEVEESESEITSDTQHNEGVEN